MGDSAAVDESAHCLSLPSVNAAEWNRDLMLKFQGALEKNPDADLMSFFPASYRQVHERAQHRELSYAAQINLRTLNDLRNKLNGEPETDLLSAFPKNYARRIRMATAASSSKSPTDKEERQIQGRGLPEFRTRLEIADTATITFPLSEEAKALLAQYPSLPGNSNSTEYLLAASLKQLVWSSPKIWESPVRGVVVRGNKDLVVKVITQEDEDYTEYTSMQYITERVPDIPVPRTHGMIQLGPFRAIFMSYIPGVTLSEAWPGLAREDKTSIQFQLDNIFRKLRALRQADGIALGGVGGEGAKEYRLSENPQEAVITTAKGFDSLQFSAPHHGSRTYIEFLRSFLADENANLHGSIFTHGDMKRTNIMVARGGNGDHAWIITGIIDWEDSGFYPEYYESTTLTGNLSLVDEDDWCLYLPDSVSPFKFPVRWLVDRLWDIHLKTS